MNCKPDKMKLSICLLQPPNIPNEPKYNLNTFRFTRVKTTQTTTCCMVDLIHSPVVLYNIK